MSPTHLMGKIQFIEAEGRRMRIFTRTQIQGEVIVHDEEHLFVAKLHDISAGGIFIHDLISLTPGSVVHLVIRSPRLARSVQATGRVVRIVTKTAKNSLIKEGTAVEFTSISSRAREIIHNCVSEQRMTNMLEAA